jgi:hypothetical protein
MYGCGRAIFELKNFFHSEESCQSDGPLYMWFYEYKNTFCLPMLILVTLF